MSLETTYCGNCGQRLKAAAKFCHCCGVDIGLFKSYPIRPGERVSVELDPPDLTAPAERQPPTGERSEVRVEKSAELLSPAQNQAAGPPRNRALAGRSRLLGFAVLVFLLFTLGGAGMTTLWRKYSTAQTETQLSQVGSVNREVTRRPPEVRPQFSLDLSLTTKTKYAERATGSADEQFAIIEPNGVLTLTTEQVFSDQPGADLQVIGLTSSRARYRIYCWDIAQQKWERIDTGQGGGEHDMGHHHLYQSNKLQIRNVSREPLLIDTVVVKNWR